MSATITRNPNPQSQPNDGAPMPGSTPGDGDTRNRVMDDETQLEKIIGWYKIDRDHWADWRQEAATCFDFRAGHQWAEDDLQILRDQMRPAITFNRIGPFLDAVGGLEINNRQETQYVPRQVGASGVNDLLTGAAQWARQECDAEDEETEAFLDVVTCGVGCIQTRMNYDDDPDGMPAIERVDPLEVLPDSAARKQNFADGRRAMRVKDIPIEDARELFPDYDDMDLHAQWAEDEVGESQQPHNARLAPYYRIDQSGNQDRNAFLVRMVEVEWWQFEPAYRVLDQSTGRFVLLDEEKAARYALRARVLGLRPNMVRDRIKKYYKAIVGGVILKKMDGPKKGGFQLKFITGKRDVTKGTWYGLVRAMCDPQMWSNKWLSQGLHILNTNAKGGYFAETDAFADIDEARDSIADSDSIVEVNPGALEKIKPKEPPAFPPQLNTMLDMAQQAIPMVSGVNMELMGQSTSTAPQVALLEAGRKQQGMNVLAALFNAKRRYQKEQGRLLLWMILEYITDGRLIRIGGPENAQYVALVHEPGLVEYDVIVEDAPTSTNMKERVWGSLMQLFPMLRGMAIPPPFYINALKYAPVPASFVAESQKILAAPPPPNPAMQGKEMLDQARAQSESSRAAVHQATAAKLAAQTAEIQVNTQHIPASVALDLDQKRATIEKTRADAANALQDAGITADDMRFKQTMAAIEALLGVHGAMISHEDQLHRHKMAVAGHGLAAQGQDAAQQQAARQQNLAEQTAQQQSQAPVSQDEEDAS